MDPRRYKLAAACTVWLVATLSCSDADSKDLETTLAAIISSYDQQVTFTCPCFVEQGGYADTDECKMWLGSRPDWLACATAALQSKYDNPAAIEALRCVDREAELTNDCLTTSSCGSPERDQCFSSPLKCLSQQIDLVLDLDNACPDFSLLPRQKANDMAGSP